MDPATPEGDVGPRATQTNHARQQLSTRDCAFIFSAAVVCGIIGDALLFVRPLGIGFTLSFYAIIGVLVACSWRSKRSLANNGRYAWIGAATLFATLVAIRSSPWLTSLNISSASLCLLLAIGRIPSGRFASSGLVEILGGAARALVFSLCDAGARVLPQQSWRSSVKLRTRLRVGESIRAVALGAATLTLFGSLLASSDARFQHLAQRFTHSFSGMPSHVLQIVLVSWLVMGLLYVTVARTSHLIQRPLTPTGGRGAEALIVLSVLIVLFTGFVVLQLETLFGGARHVLATHHLTVAQYARRGFFQLLGVVALVLPLLLVADSATRNRKAHYYAKILSQITVTLTLVIAASALHRLWLYQQTFGLTELRLYASSFVALLMVVLIVFSATIGRGRNSWFAITALITSFGYVVGLNLANPDALIARVNIQRVTEHPTRNFDIRSILSLSEDATPTILGGLDSLPVHIRRELRETLQSRAGEESEDWRSWNLGRSRSAQQL